jgi:hypothetical protein
MSLILMCPCEKMIAFVGVATGNIKAKLTEMINGNIKYNGLILSSKVLNLKNFN